ncbi:MAG: LPXTG cell wall anchor domain-containing protein, partial [Oscillospiraceae bacterium]|nr:LPXTG cell wall anchor domain-containing protein [Oscillospiraceae bacterium]
VSAYHSPAVTQPFDVSKVLFKDNALEFTAQFAGGVQSELGTYVEVKMNTAIDSSKNYMWECDGQTGKAFVSTFGSGDSAYSTISFYAPHFSTYVITAVNNEAPAPDAAPEAAPAPTVLANTGADMSFAILGVVGLGALAVLGSALALKKRGAKN